MFSGLEVSDKYTHNCLKHGSSKVIYFCGDAHCYESLCSACKSEHINHHAKIDTDCLLLSFPMVLAEIKDKIRTSIRRLNSYINNLKSEEESTIVSPNMSVSPSLTMRQELEDVKKEYQEILHKLDGPDCLKILKTAYGREYETEFEGLKRKFSLNRLSSEGPFSDHHSVFEARNNIGSKRALQGLGSIVEELRDYGYRRGQPLQSGSEEEIPVSNFRQEQNTNEDPNVRMIAPQKRTVNRPLQLNIAQIIEDNNIPEPLKTFDQTGSLQSLTPIDFRETSMISKITLESPAVGSGMLSKLKIPIQLGSKSRDQQTKTPFKFARPLRESEEADTFDYHNQSEEQLSFDNTFQGSIRLHPLSASSVKIDENYDFLKTFRE